MKVRYSCPNEAWGEGICQVSKPSLFLLTCAPIFLSLSLVCSPRHFLSFFLMPAIKLDGFARQSLGVIGLNGPSSSHLSVLLCSWAFDYVCPPFPCHPWIGIAQTVPAELAEKALTLSCLSLFRLLQVKGRAAYCTLAASKPKLLGDGLWTFVTCSAQILGEHLQNMLGLIITQISTSHNLQPY